MRRKKHKSGRRENFEMCIVNRNTKERVVRDFEVGTGNRILNPRVCVRVPIHEQNCMHVYKGTYILKSTQILPRFAHQIKPSFTIIKIQRVGLFLILYRTIYSQIILR
jgi:hypothetical protein